MLSKTARNTPLTPFGQTAPSRGAIAKVNRSQLNGSVARNVELFKCCLI